MQWVSVVSRMERLEVIPEFPESPLCIQVSRPEGPRGPPMPPRVPTFQAPAAALGACHSGVQPPQYRHLGADAVDGRGEGGRMGTRLPPVAAKPTHPLGTWPLFLVSLPQIFAAGPPAFSLPD